ncbi:hypothetical protein TVAG_426230 [Trichomonas vaginalis G3]|uniref:Uncharacterized protein n=1 Tax=Trichomonas vaginalis (strain ATCC PRA-98 / G3) TaxID=412133 RepID=A2DYP0_TRIV3|nr:hypothetical protein TVAGG3_0850730 [Trichomonas vaginalis G3]EAY14430.1 hypothetical protein TVAG_426230 [Trichomonas vaginalis G3]KAI5499964.1 hypothetical protein TVAGG3_0850730 [Trichomonas vaginalis G3]|eukprot:XP_001326653.1 hypothetical protein [Trichomonas vaginalis G3]
MLSILLSSIAYAKEVPVPGAYSDLVESELELTFTPKENFDSFVIFPKPENFKVNDRDLKRVYTNPTSLTIKANNNYLNYSYVQLKKGKCDTLDFIMNKYSNDWVEMYPGGNYHNFCSIFANPNVSNSVFYRRYTKAEIQLYDNFVLDGKSYLKWTEGATFSVSYNTLIAKYISSEDVEYRVSQYYGINNNTNKSMTDIYHVQAYDSRENGYAIIDDIVDFKYGNYNVDVHNEYILTIPQNSIMLITERGLLRIKVFSGTVVVDDPDTIPEIAGFVFASDSYVRVTGNSSLSFIMIKNTSLPSKFNKVVTIFGEKDYTVKYDADSQYSIFAVTKNGDIKVSKDKNAKYYDMYGNEISNNQKFADFVYVSIDHPKSKSSISFKVGGNTQYPMVIKDTRGYNNYHIIAINETTSYGLNEEDRDDELDFLKWLIPLIITGIVVGVLLVIGVAVFIIWRCKKTNDSPIEYKKV